jgi:hypothetical protein
VRQNKQILIIIHNNQMAGEEDDTTKKKGERDNVGPYDVVRHAG